MSLEKEMGLENVTCIDKKELAELRRRAALYEEQKPKQWEVPEGGYILQGNGKISTIPYNGDYRRPIRNFGMSFTSIEQVEEAKPLIRSHNRLIRYVQEHGGIQEFVAGQENYTVDLTDLTLFISLMTQIIGSIYMTKQCAESLAAGLKDGSIEL